MIARWQLLFLGLVAAAGLGCGVVTSGLEPADAGSADAGKLCFEDSECVPDACCGRGINSVHVDDGPDCTSAFCDGQCPLAQLRCGCAIPVCRDRRCAVAVTTGNGCP